MDLYLHIGAHRTATTTFQRFLRHNEQSLRDAGLESWTPQVIRQSLFQGLFGPGNADTPADVRKRSMAVGRIKLRMDGHWGEGRRALLVSEENMIGAPRSNLMHRSLYPDLPARLGQFLPAFEDSCLKIALGIRSYDGYWTSCVTYGLARGLPIPSRRALAALVAQPRRWTDIAAEVAGLFPMAEVMVFPFEEFADRAPDMLAELTGLRIERPIAKGPQHHNVSPPVPKLRRLLKMRGLDAAASLLPSTEGRWVPFTDDQCHQMRQRYAEDLALFAGRALPGVRFCATPIKSAEARQNTNVATATDRMRDVTGFAAPARPWLPPEGGSERGTERCLV